MGAFCETTLKIEELKQYLPLIIPLIVLELVLLGYTLWHINTHREYKRGTRALWNVIAIVGMEFIGPILYFVFGKADE